MGIARDDLVFNIARHVDSTVHLFEKWGLPIWTDENGKYVREGRWQIMINGESYKVIVAEAAVNAMKEAGFEIYERVFICGPIMDGDGRRRHGFSTREKKFSVQGQGVCAYGRRGDVFVPGAWARVWPFPGIRPSTRLQRNSPSRRARDDLPGDPLHPCASGRLGPVGACSCSSERASSATGGENMEGQADLQNWVPMAW